MIFESALLINSNKLYKKHLSSVRYRPANVSIYKKKVLKPTNEYPQHSPMSALVSKAISFPRVNSNQ